MKIIAKYVNGNVKTTLFEDGSKEREYDDFPKPIHPESIDVKITDYCDAECSFCHEQSTKNGKHSDLNKLFDVLSVLPGGVEIAIGGGNPLSHPDIILFLQKLKANNIVANITINQKHIKQYNDLICYLIDNDLVKGIGISYSSKSYLKDIDPIISKTNNLVFHVIMGINKLSDIDCLYDFCSNKNKECKILILGYKNYGFGINYYIKNKSIEDNKYLWYIKLASYFKTNNLVLSFDNLAIKQMNLKRFFTNDAWNKFYMGDDFVFTMYIDGVEQKFAPSSTSNIRTDFNQTNLLEYFQNNRNM